MSTDLITVESKAPFAILENGLILNRESGEVVALQDAPDQTLAALAEQLRSQRDWFREITGTVEDVLKVRMQEQRTRMLDVGSHRVQLESRRDWDKTEAWQALSALVEAGLVSLQEADEAMPRKTERKPDGRKLNAILTRVVGEDPEKAQALAQSRSERTYIKLARTAVEGEASEE